MTIRPSDIHEGRRYRSRQGWVYRVDHVSGGQVNYTVLTGPKEGTAGVTEIADFAGRIVKAL